MSNPTEDKEATYKKRIIFWARYETKDNPEKNYTYVQNGFPDPNDAYSIRTAIDMVMQAWTSPASSRVKYILISSSQQVKKATKGDKDADEEGFVPIGKKTFADVPTFLRVWGCAKPQQS